MKCCLEPDVVVAKDRSDETIKTFCENCGKVFFTVTWEFWDRVVDFGRAKAAIQLIETMLEAA